MRTPSELRQLATLRLTASKTVAAVLFVLIVLLGALPASAQWSNGYTYRSTITIDHTKVPNTDQSNFPVLISGTYSYLATTGNGGNVTNANGYDIIFTSDSGGASTLAFEQESYSASTGAVKYWVKVPTVSHTTDTVIYMFYDNSSVTTDQSNKTGVWDSNYKGVWHLEDNAANTTVKDSTSNSDNGTSVANTSSMTATGEIDKGLSFNGSSDGITTSISSSKTFTWEAWVNTISSTNYYSIIDFGDSNFMLMQLHGGAGSFWTSDVPLYGVNLGITGLSNATWYHVVFSRSGDSGTYSAYLNGSLTGTHSSGTWSGTTTIAMGERPAYGGQYFDGTLDELRVSNSLRSADWISTEYKNQSSPSTFYTVGSATTCVSISSLSPTWGEIDSPVTITGTNFGSTQGSSTVTFNGTAATPTSWSATSIATTVPDGATTGNVVVTVSSMASNGVNFTVSSGGGSDSSGIYYYFSDQLGTARVITDANGNVCYDGDLYPYGGERAVTDVCDSNYKFTGKERDSESGLDNFGARYNSSQYGRFMTPDPLYLELHRLIDPQQLNLYSYVRNNPLSLTDPTGLDITCNGDRCKDYLTALAKDVSFKVKYDDNGKVVATVDKDAKLSKSDKAFLKAIDDTKNHVTINAVGGEKDSSVFFGASHGSTHTINFDQVALLDSAKNAGGMTSAGLVGHETLEGYDESRGYSMSEGHDYATGLGFPGLDPGRITGLFGNAQTGTAFGFTQQFQVHGTGTTENIRINFVTPIPAASVHSGMNAAGYPVSVEKAQ